MLEEICITYKNIKDSSVLESNGSSPPEKSETLLEVENMTLKTPSEATLIRDLSLEIKGKDHLLVSNPFKKPTLKKESQHQYIGKAV